MKLSCDDARLSEERMRFQQPVPLSPCAWCRADGTPLRQNLTFDITSLFYRGWFYGGCSLRWVTPLISEISWWRAINTNDVLNLVRRPQNKKLGCGRDTARCFMSLNSLLTHSGSLKVTENGTIRKLGYGLLFAFHSNYGPILCDSDHIGLELSTWASKFSPHGSVSWLTVCLCDHNADIFEV